jgi:hypothetical protein
LRSEARLKRQLENLYRKLVGRKSLILEWMEVPVCLETRVENKENARSYVVIIEKSHWLEKWRLKTIPPHSELEILGWQAGAEFGMVTVPLPGTDFVLANPRGHERWPSNRYARSTSMPDVLSFTLDSGSFNSNGSNN